MLSGTPTQPGSQSITVQANDGFSEDFLTIALSIVGSGDPPPTPADIFPGQWALPSSPFVSPVMTLECRDGTGGTVTAQGQVTIFEWNVTIPTLTGSPLGAAVQEQARVEYACQGLPTDTDTFNGTTDYTLDSSGDLNDIVFGEVTYRVIDQNQLTVIDNESGLEFTLVRVGG